MGKKLELWNKIEETVAAEGIELFQECDNVTTIYTLISEPLQSLGFDF